MKRQFDKRTIFLLIVVVFVVICAIPLMNNRKAEETIHHVTGIVIEAIENDIIIKSEEDELYKFDKNEIDEKAGTEISIDYKKNENKSNSTDNSSNAPSGNTSKDNVDQKNEVTDDNTVVDYTVIEPSKIPDSWLDGGIFSSHYVAAYDKLKNMTLDEKIGQVLIVRYPDSGAINLINQYHLGGYVFYAKDFGDKTKAQVISMINSAQTASKIPLLTATDEEGGTVSRLSGNAALAPTPFKSPQELYADGGFDAIAADTRNKSRVLKELGINLNFAPVVDVSENPSDYIYKRTLGQGTQMTSTFASTVIGVSKGTGVSYTLKHFPGYGSNLDTHLGGSTSKKSYADIMNEDIPPFKAGITAGAEVVMVSHNIVESIDATNESSISQRMHTLLRNDLGFTGIIVTDDISMGAMKNVSNIGGKAIAAGNDLIITSDVATTFNQIKSSIENGSVNEETLNRAVFRLLAWKYYKGLM